MANSGITPVLYYARGRVFGPVGVGSTRYLDNGGIDFPESGVSDGWPYDFFLEPVVSESWSPNCFLCIESPVLQMAGHH